MIDLNILKKTASTLGDLDNVNGSYIDKVACIDESTIILPGTVIIGDVKIGKNNIIGPYTVIGAPAQHWGYYTKEIEGCKKIKIGNGNIIREFVTIHSSTQQDTLIGNNCLLMTQSHVSHDTVIEDNVVLANSVQIGGHSCIMEGTNIGLGANIHQYSTIGAYSMVGMGSIITKDIPPFLVYKNFKCYKTNRIGLKRNGFSDGQIKKIDAYFNQKEMDFECFFAREKRILNIFYRFLKVRNPHRSVLECEINEK